MRIAIFFSAVLVAPLIAATASADWPVARHDAARSAASPNASDIKKPAAYWRSYLGGGPDTNQIYVGDVDGDGKMDVLVVRGGQPTLFRPDGTTLWKGADASVYTGLIGVQDLDGDGHLDVIASSRGRVGIFDGASGSLEWKQPDDVGTLQSARLADVDNDGHADLWVDTCGCCAVENGSPGDVYSFAAGVKNAKLLLSPASRSHCGSNSNTIGDWDGDGVLDLMNATNDTLTMFRSNGSVLATSDPINAHVAAARCEPVNVDGIPGDEALCFENVYFAGAGDRAIFLVAYRPAETPSIKVLWRAQLTALDGGDARAPSRMYADLDGNGTLEAIASGKVNDAYVTHVFDALTGTQLSTAAGLAVGVVQNNSGKGNWLLVTNATQVIGYALTGSPPALTQAWSVDDRAVSTSRDWALAAVTDVAATAITPDLNGDGHADLILQSTTEPFAITGYDLGGGQPAPLGTYALDASVGIAAVGISQAGAQDPLFVSRNDGFVALLDSKLAATNLGKQGNDIIPGIRIGGYFINAGVSRGPIAGKISPGDTRDSVLVVDSRGDLVRIDPTNASNVAPAKPAWRATDSFGASLPGGGGKIACYRRVHPVTEVPKYAMATLEPSGQQSTSFQLNRPPAGDVVPGNLLGTSANAFAGMQADANLGVDLVAMDGFGAQVWSQSFVAGAGVQPISISDWNGDGLDDVAVAINAAHVYSGSDGSLLESGGYPVSYFMPIVTDLDGDGLPDLLLQGGYQDALALKHDLTTVLWQAGANDLPYPYGAMATCPDKVLIEGSYASSARLRFTVASGPSAGTTKTLVLASGAAYPDETSATAAGAALGQLGDVAVSSNLSGGGGNPTALVGSTDDYLYGLDACTGALLWSLSLGAPVGSPILADTDGDGQDEILVSAADGYLYALKNEILPAPAVVNDTDPPHGIDAMDVDDIVTTDTLYAEWSAVSGATSYEIAVVGGAGTYLTTPEWTDVGNATSATLSPLPLVDGGIYFVGVRAVGPQGRSPDTASDGVVVHGGGGAGAGGAGGSTGGAGGSAGQGGAAPNGEGPLLSGRACTCGVVGSADSTSALSLCGLCLLALGLRLRKRGRFMRRQ